MSIHYTDVRYTRCMEDGALVGNKFSVRQVKAIGLFAAGTHNCTQVAEEVEVSQATISKWRRNDQFMDAIFDEAKRQLRADLPNIYKVTKDFALKGNYQHIKIILEHLDSLDTHRRDSGTVTFSWDM